MAHKTDEKGKPKFIEPAGGPWQELPQQFQWSEYIVTSVSADPDLLDGVISAGIRPKNVTDVLMLQRHKRPAAFEHNFLSSTFLPQAVPQAFLTGEIATLQIYGPIRLGKTEWACAQFKNPLLVTSRDSLRGYCARVHDGIVLDKMDFRNWSVTDCEALTDWMQPATVPCRYGDARIPKHTRKIVVTNAEGVWPPDQHGQLVGRRVLQMCISARMY